MSTKRLLAMVMLAATAGCGDVPTQGGAAPPSQPALSVYDASTLTLGVSVTGVNKMVEAGPAELTASVTGGTGPYHYYWYSQECTNYGCGGMYLKDHGEGMSTSSGIYVHEEDIYVRTKVIVADASGTTWTGGSAKTIIGPAVKWTTTTTYCYPGDDTPPLGHYPFYTPLPPSPSTQTGDYYINPCNDQRIYKLK